MCGCPSLVGWSMCFACVFVGVNVYYYSYPDSSLTEEMAALPAASSDMPPVCGTPDPQV